MIRVRSRDIESMSMSLKGYFSHIKLEMALVATKPSQTRNPKKAPLLPPCALVEAMMKARTQKPMIVMINWTIYSFQIPFDITSLTSVSDNFTSDIHCLPKAIGEYHRALIPKLTIEATRMGQKLIVCMKMIEFRLVC